MGIKGRGTVNTRSKKCAAHLRSNKKVPSTAYCRASRRALHCSSDAGFTRYNKTEPPRFLQTIEEPEALAKRAVQHPALGELPLDQWIEMVYMHEQRHIKQLQEIVRK